jgi:hypothetical protein
MTPAEKRAAVVEAVTEAVNDAWEDYRVKELPKPGKGAPAAIFTAGYIAAIRHFLEKLEPKQ